MQVDQGDEVHLVLPAQPAYARVARIAAAHLALRRGFSLAEIDDLRMVIDEATAMLIGDGSDGRIDINYRVDRDTLNVSAALVTDAGSPPPLADARVQAFVGSVGSLVDEFSVAATTSSVALRKTKS